MMRKAFLGLAVVILTVAVVLLAALAVVTQPFVSVKTTMPAPKVDAAALERHTRVLSEQFYPRDCNEKRNLEAVASYIHDSFVEAKATVEDQWFPVQGRSYRNIVARFGPDSGPVTVVGAHYDSWSPTLEDEDIDGDAGTPGADDNASGIAGLLELARLLQLYPPKTPVLLVAYCLEEPPFFRTSDMGSAVHARALAASGVDIRAVIVLEMIGYFSDAPGSQTYPHPLMGKFYPSVGNFISVVGRPQDMLLTRKVKAAMRAASDVPVYSINAPALVTGIDFSDHSSYWGEGISAVMITDTAFFRNTAYHTTGDIPDRLDYPRMAKIVQGVYAAVQGMGE